MKTIITVGGTWDAQGGRPSKLFDQLVADFQKTFGAEALVCRNGGPIESLAAILAEANEPPVILWMPDVPNEHQKVIDGLKGRFPKTILIGSKRLDGRTIGVPEVIDRMLKVKQNLCLLLDRSVDGQFEARLLDPLGNSFGHSRDFFRLGCLLGERTHYLVGVRRVRSEPIGEALPMTRAQTYCDPEFFPLIQRCAQVFDQLVPRPEQVSRFLGNAAFRCSYGFPAFRSPSGLICISRRNVDKRDIGPESFVPVEPFRLYDGSVRYHGNVAPSVDAPIDLLIFHRFPEINYLIHGHVYLKGVPMTDRPIPCGAVEEFDAIEALLRSWNPQDVQNIRVNLKGHGCLLAAKSVGQLLEADSMFIARPLMEPA